MPEVVELYVVMHCEACEASVKRAIKKIPGVESYKIDYYGQKVTVVGNVDRVDVWRRIHKTGRCVTLIAKPAPPPKKPEENKKEETTKKEEITETKVEEKTTTEIVKVEEQKIEETTAMDTKQEVKVHEVTEEVVTVVEITEEGEERKQETTTVKEEQGNKKKEPKKPQWVPMFISAPYYTLPNTFYN